MLVPSGPPVPGSVTVVENQSPAGSPVLLGVGESGVHVEIKPRYKEVFTVSGGDATPDDLMFMGSEAIVSTIMTVSNWTVIQFLSARPNPNKVTAPVSIADNINVDTSSAAGFVAAGLAGLSGNPDSPSLPGTEPSFGVGDLVRRGGYGVHVWVVFPYAAKVSNSNSGLVKGYHFFSGIMMATDIDAGNRAAKVPVTFRCLRSKSDSTGAWQLYDYDFGSLPPPNPGPVNTGFKGYTTGTTSFDNNGEPFITPFTSGGLVSPPVFETGIYNPFTGTYTQNQ